MKFKHSLLLVFSLLLTTLTFAQNYDRAVGIRAGFPYGVTGKMMLNNVSAAEIILASRYNGFVVTGLYELQYDISSVSGLAWYAGFGAHVGFYGDRYWDDDEKDGGMVLGPDGIIGLDYTFDSLPINISLDWKPGFHLIGNGFAGDNGALSIRLVF